MVDEWWFACQRRHRDEEGGAEDERAEEHSLADTPHNPLAATVLAPAIVRLGHLQLRLLLHDRLKLRIRSHRCQELVHLLPGNAVFVQRFKKVI